MISSNTKSPETLTGGNTVDDKPYVDSRSNFYLVDTNNPINGIGEVTGWEIWAENTLPVQLIIYRKTADSWSIVGQSEVKTPVTGANDFSLSTLIKVETGDFVGSYYPQQGSVSFSKPDSEAWDLGNLSGKVLFTQSGANATAFSGSTNRIYSIKVKGNLVETNTLEDGLIAHYLFDSNPQDTSGHNLHGTVYGATLTADRFGNPESAYQFDGVDDYIEVAHNDLLNLTDNFTISLWLKQSEAHAAGYRLVDKITANGTDGYLFDTYDGSTGKKLRFIRGSQGANANTVYSLNEWHHVAVVFSKGVSTFYLDGHPDGSGNHSSSIPNNSLSLRIGTSHGSNNEFFKGALDDIRIYNRALSETEVQEVYKLPSSKKAEEKQPVPETTVTPKVEITTIVYKDKVKKTQSDEYVEITNQEKTVADVSGWQIASGVGRNKSFTFPQGTKLAPGQSVRVYTNEIHPESGGFSCGSKLSLWKDSGDEAKLLDAKGNFVFGLAYDSKGNFTKTAS